LAPSMATANSLPSWSTRALYAAQALSSDWNLNSCTTLELLALIWVITILMSLTCVGVVAGYLSQLTPEVVDPV